MKFMKTLTKTSSLIYGVFALAVCVFSLYNAISVYTITSKQNKNYTGETDALVVDYEVRQEEQTFTDSDGFDRTEIVDMYYPILNYTVDGQEYNVVYESGSSEKAYKDNATLKINYLPEDPTQFYIAGDAFRMFVPYGLMIMALGTGFIAVKMFMCFKNFK